MWAISRKHALSDMGAWNTQTPPGFEYISYTHLSIPYSFYYSRYLSSTSTAPSPFFQAFLSRGATKSMENALISFSTGTTTLFGDSRCLRIAMGKYSAWGFVKGGFARVSSGREGSVAPAGRPSVDRSKREL